MKYLRRLMPVCLLVCAICSFARGQTWESLGHTEIGRDQNHESIQILRRDQLFRNIQLRITGDAIFFDRLVFRFANGTSEEFVVSGRISSEEKNRVFDLPKESALDSVEFWYFKESWKHTPRVSLYGIRLPDNDDESIMSQH